MTMPSTSGFASAHSAPGAIVTETKSRPKKTPVTSPRVKSAVASGEAAASSGLAKSRVPASMTGRPGRNFRVAGLGVDSVSISMRRLGDADRKSVVKGNSVIVRGGLGGRRIIKKKKKEREKNRLEV